MLETASCSDSSHTSPGSRHESSSSVIYRSFDVIIVGAGPGGLACALALQTACPGLSVRILERARQMRPCGGNMGITSPNVITAFRAIGEHVVRAFQAVCLRRSTLSTADWDGANKVMHAVPACNVSWFDLQQALLSLLPCDAVYLNSGVASVRPRPPFTPAACSEGPCTPPTGFVFGMFAFKGRLRPQASSKPRCCHQLQPAAPLVKCPCHD